MYCIITYESTNALHEVMCTLNRLGSRSRGSGMIFVPRDHAHVYITYSVCQTSAKNKMKLLLFLFSLLELALTSML